MTAQINEVLILDGEETSMAFCPPFPIAHPRIVKLTEEEREGEDLILQSTACWRGYQGTWEIKGGRFYLVDLRGAYELLEGDPIHADWFSGMIRIPRGGVLEYVHMGFGTVHEEELHIKIENGIVVNTEVIDNRGKKHDPWEIRRRNLPGHENRIPGDEEV